MVSSAAGTLRAYATATHFGPTVAVTAFTAALALTSGAGLRTLLICAAVLTGQLSIGWSNDYLDAGIDRAAGRRDKPVVRGSVSERGLRRAAVAAATLTVPLSLANGLAAGAAALGTTACGLAYNLGLKRTLASAVPYAVAFALTPPLFVALALDQSPRAQVVAAGGLLGLCAHFTNAVKDLDADALTGVRGLPQRLGPRISGVVSAALLLVAAGVLLLPGSSPSALSLLLAGSAAALAAGYAALIAAGRQEHGFSLNLAAVALLVAAVVTR
ncbi:MAG: UbiA family prenyltransferase [Actinomycetota bacterium]